MKILNSKLFNLIEYIFYVKLVLLSIILLFIPLQNYLAVFSPVKIFVVVFPKNFPWWQFIHKLKR